MNLNTASPEELEKLARVFEHLVSYTKTKARAIRDRAQGEIDDALSQENLCEQYLKCVPEEVKVAMGLGQTPPYARCPFPGCKCKPVLETVGTSKAWVCSSGKPHFVWAI